MNRIVLRGLEYLAQVRIKWRKILNSIMKFRVSRKCFLIGVRHFICFFFCQFVSQSVWTLKTRPYHPLKCSHSIQLILTTTNPFPLSRIFLFIFRILLSIQKCAVMCLSLCILQLIHDINRTELISVDGGQVQTVWTAGRKDTNSNYQQFGTELWVLWEKVWVGLALVQA